MKRTTMIMRNLYFIGFAFLLVINAQIFAGNTSEVNDDDYNKGITVSPSHMNFSVDLGKTTTKTIKVSNYTGKTQKFNVSYQDFDISESGKSSFLEAGTSDYSLSRLINISPTFLEIKPGGFAEVSVTITVPANDEANRAAWGVLVIEQMEEKKVLDPGNASGNTVAFGITPTFAFGVWLYQNPPQVENMMVDINNFYLETSDTSKMILMDIENKGDGISFCNAYVEVTNMQTGEQKVLDGKRYTILPGYKRSFIFDITEALPAGNYSAVGVLDYKSNEELVAAELEFSLE